MNTTFTIPTFRLPGFIASVGRKLPQWPHAMALVGGLNAAMKMNLLPEDGLSALEDKLFRVSVLDTGGHNGYPQFVAQILDPVPELSLLNRATRRHIVDFIQQQDARPERRQYLGHRAYPLRRRRFFSKRCVHGVEYADAEVADIRTERRDIDDRILGGLAIRIGIGRMRREKLLQQSRLAVIARSDHKHVRHSVDWRMRQKVFHIAKDFLGAIVWNPKPLLYRRNTSLVIELGQSGRSFAQMREFGRTLTHRHRP